MSIVIRNGKIVWKHGLIVDIFAWTWIIWGGRTENTSKQQKMVAFFEELLSENDFEAVLATFCCYDYGANASEAVQKIATDQKDYHRCSSCVIVCWIVKIYQSLKKGRLPTY